MSILDLPRVPEPEVMDDSAEVQAYASPEALAQLDKIDDTFVAHAVRLAGGRTQGRALDVGTGPGQIPTKLAQHLPGWSFLCIDRSAKMLEFATRSAMMKGLAGRVRFLQADGSAIRFEAGTFDLVMCNSMLHHAAEPQRVLAEIARVAKPDGAILIRDLRRPSRLLFDWHVRRHGAAYSGKMRGMYETSLRAAYTVKELEEMLRATPIPGARIFTHEQTHLGIERPAAG
jgi:ubiquinone/menaquinone biosynthesis C-methylase UbiE